MATGAIWYSKNYPRCRTGGSLPLLIVDASTAVHSLDTDDVTTSTVPGTGLMVAHIENGSIAATYTVSNDGDEVGAFGMLANDTRDVAIQAGFTVAISA